MFQFVDRYSSTLASSYTSGGSSLSVGSAANLPSDGTCDFYLIVKAEGANTEEVFHVTSKTGTTLTVTGAQANTTASNHASGAVVIGTIMTSAGYSSFRQDIIQAGAYASAVAANAGNLYLATDGVAIRRDNGSTFNKAWGPIFPHTGVPSSSWSWDNQGGASVLSGGGVETIKGDASSSGLRIRYRTAPSPPYTLSFVISRRWAQTANAGKDQRGGVLFRKASDGKIVSYTFAVDTSDNPYMATSKWTNSTTFSADYTLSSGVTTPWNYIIKFSQLWFVQIQDNNTNLIFSYSCDWGVNWIQFDSRGRTDFMSGGPDQWGFFTQTTSAQAVDVSLLAVRQE